MINVKILLSIFLISLSVYGKIGITQDNDTLRDLVIFNQDSAIAVGFIGGNIAKTQNGGHTWRLQETPTNERINSIFFINRIGWAVGDEGVLLKSTNWGDEWIALGRKFTDAYIQSIFFIDEQSGWAVSQNGKIFHTNDAGISWFKQYSQTSDHLNSVFFLNDRTGFIVGGAWPSKSSVILKTVNSGQTWTTVYDKWQAPICDIFFINDSTGWAVGDESIILKTNDLGQTWKVQQSPVWETFLSTFFLNEQNGFVVGSNGAILKTVDGGETWLINSYRETDNQFNSIKFVDQNVGWVVGTFGHIQKTVDCGNEWMLQNIQTNVLDIQNENKPNYILLKNYPNPFNSSTNIVFEISNDCEVKINIYNVSGIQVESILKEIKSAGMHSINWTPNKLPSGIYICHVTAGDFHGIQKMVLLE